jgi:DNA-binding CsgD family transcriptional regulator
MSKEQSISKFSLEFRDLMVKVIREDFRLENKGATLDLITLSQQYKSIIDNINGFILISNYTLGMYEYISDGVRHNLGYDLSKSTKEEMTDFMISIIKDEHRDFLLNVLFPTVLKYFKTNSTATTGTDYRYTCCLQLRNSYDEYIWYLVDTVLFEVDENGFPVRALITCTNIDQVKKDDCVYYNITKKNAEGIYEVVLEGTADNRISELKLTSREIQIINLISQGSTNQQIADKLFISLNTVQTHRKNIMKKTKCSGTAELTNFAFTRGLL